MVQSIFLQSMGAVKRRNKAAYSRAHARIVGRCSPHQGNSSSLQPNLSHTTKRVKKQTLLLFTDLFVH